VGGRGPKARPVRPQRWAVCRLWENMARVIASSDSSRRQPAGWAQDRGSIRVSLSCMAMARKVAGARPDGAIISSLKTGLANASRSAPRDDLPQAGFITLPVWVAAAARAAPCRPWWLGPGSGSRSAGSSSQLLELLDPPGIAGLCRRSRRPSLGRRETAWGISRCQRPRRGLVSPGGIWPSGWWASAWPAGRSAPPAGHRRVVALRQAKASVVHRTGGEMETSVGASANRRQFPH